MGTSEDEMGATIARLQEKLALLRSIDDQLRRFGASSHKYVLNPCVPEARLEDVEATYGIRLPPEYRAFLSQMGNVGAGPDYGVFTLEYSLEHSFDNGPEGLQLLAKPFPHRSHWNLDHRMYYPRLGEHEGLIAFEEEYFRDEYVQGALLIQHQGCAHVTLLVVNGPEYGNLWGDSRTSDYGIYPFPNQGDPAARIGFFAWYEAWLDASMPYIPLSVLIHE